MGSHIKSLGILRKVEKQIIALEFSEAYSELRASGYSFNFKNLARDFPKVDVMTMYMLLMFAISLDESVEKHLAICYYLYFKEPYVQGADLLIKWHLLRSLEISPCNQDVLRNWIFGVYSGNPDCPFSTIELEEFHKQLI